jgi:DNA polymerase-1
MSAAPTLYLIDGSGYIFRAFYGVRPMATSQGVPTNAVVGFARMLGRLLRDEKPALLGIAFDGPEKTFRHAIYSDYKANRDEPPEDLVPQFELIRKLVEAMDIPVLTSPGFEADDVIATLAHLANERGHTVIVVSGDKDLMQLVSPDLSIFDPMRDKRIDRQAVIERFGVPPERVADAQALAGDSSDNIPGVPKVGPKSAAKLLSTFGNLEAVLAGVVTLPKPKAFERSVIEYAERARLSKKLTVLRSDVPVELDIESLKYSAPRPEKIEPFLQSIEAYTLLRDFGLSSDDGDTPPAAPAAQQPAETSEPQLQAESIDRSAYRTITRIEDLDAEIAAARQAGQLSFDLETTSLDANCAKIVGVALAVPGRPAVYVPIIHRYLGAPKQLELAEVLERLRPLLEERDFAILGQNLKYDMIVLARAGIALRGIAHDSMVAAYVLDPSRLSFSLDALAHDHLGHQTIRYKEVTGTGKDQLSFDQVELGRATEYAAEDADVALRLCRVLGDRAESAGLGQLYREIELPLVPVLAEMEQTGVLIDVARLHALSQEFSKRLVAIERRAHDIVGSPVNLASPKQLAHLFFEQLKYPVIKRTKTGYSTDQEVLEVLARDHELPRVILEHRLLAKLKSTYVDALPKMVNKQTGRVHTSFNQTGTATGRLSSSDPNLQNIPIRSEDGRRIREAFIASDDGVLVSADYSQIELRIMAHLSGDQAFVDAFRRGEDIHERTAREVLTGGRDPTSDERRQAKAINFGILYGLSEYGLSRQIGITRSEAGTFLATYFARYPRIRDYLDRTIEDARTRGYVSTIAGRRRFLPDLGSRNRTLRQAAERIAMNTPVQGSAADLIKMAMLKIAGALAQRRLEARLLLQVHDELVLEAPQAERDQVVELVRHEMTEVMDLSVPLVVDVGCAGDWAGAH